MRISVVGAGAIGGLIGGRLALSGEAVTLIDFPLTRELATRMMEEAQAVAHRLGITFRLPIEKRIEGAERVGKHRPSTLQDVQAGRPLELDPVIGAVVELGRLTGVPTPHTDAVYALVKLLDHTLQEAQAAVRLSPPRRRVTVVGTEGEALPRAAP